MGVASGPTSTRSPVPARSRIVGSGGPRAAQPVPSLTSARYMPLWPVAGSTAAPLPLTVTNVSGMLLQIRLRSGDSLHLRPGEQTGELADAEVQDNPRVDTLVDRGLVRVDDVAAAPAPPPASDETAGTAEADKPR